MRVKIYIKYKYIGLVVMAEEVSGFCTQRVKTQHSELMKSETADLLPRKCLLPLMGIDKKK